MENKNERTGLIHIYCGDGKGKTTAAIGAAIRAAGRGFRVLVLRLLKTNDSGEVNALQNIPEIHVLPLCALLRLFMEHDAGAERESGCLLFRTDGKCLENGPGNG